MKHEKFTDTAGWANEETLDQEAMICVFLLRYQRWDKDRQFDHDQQV